MQGNYTILDIQKYLDNGANFKGRKPAKLSTYKVFYPKTVALQNSIKKNISTASNDIKPVLQPEVNENNMVVKPSEPVAAIAPQEPTRNGVEIKPEEKTTLSLPSKETLETRMQNINAVIYKGISGNIVDIATYRRLRIGVPVIESMENATSKIGIEPVILKPTEPIDESKKEPIDFSQFPNVNNFPSSEVSPQLQEEKEVSTPKIDDSNVRLENYLSQGTTNLESNSVDDVNIIEINSLMKEKETTEDSLQTQKEILANLRKRIEQNKVLCEAKKQELIEENMALTRELNDVLAEINQLSDIATQQEAFLGNSVEDNSYGKRIA